MQTPKYCISVFQLIKSRKYRHIKHFSTKEGEVLEKTGFFVSLLSDNHLLVQMQCILLPAEDMQQEEQLGGKAL